MDKTQKRFKTVIAEAHASTAPTSVLCEGLQRGEVAGFPVAEVDAGPVFANMLARQDRFLSLGVARWGRDQISLRALFCSGDSALRCAVLANPNIEPSCGFLFSPFATRAALFGTDEEERAFLESAAIEELEACFTNPALPDRMLRDLFERRGSFDQFDDDKWMRLLVCGAKHPKLRSRKPLFPVSYEPDPYDTDTTIPGRGA